MKTMSLRNNRTIGTLFRLVLLASFTTIVSYCTSDDISSTDADADADQNSEGKTDSLGEDTETNGFDTFSEDSVEADSTHGDSDDDSGSIPAGNECDNTAECQTQYPGAIDCEDAKSDQSWCECEKDGVTYRCRELASPTCDDGVGNGGETGVDCGGPCPDCGSKSAWRWAHSGDGNQHDPDDWHASAMALALMRQAGLKHKLVHFDWNNHLGDNSPSMKNEHDWHVNTARQAFGYANDRVFKNCQEDLDGAVAHLRDVINASSADSRLVLTCAGPMEVCWRGIDAADDDKEPYVVVISHSTWNDNHADTSQMNHTWSDIVEDFDVQAHHINDQNPPAFKSSCSEWSWTKTIPGFGETLYDLLCLNTKAAGDASDAGMVYYMIQQDGAFDGNSGASKPSMSEVQSFFGIFDSDTGGAGSFTEQNGVIEFEIEELEPRGSWVFARDVSGYSGDGYFAWEGGDILSGPTTNSVLIGSTLTVKMQINTPGKYRMTITSRRNYSGECAGAANDQCNDVFTNVNGKQWCKTLVKSDWDKWVTSTQLECSHGNFSAPVYDFVTGENTLLLTGRSRGVLIDKFRFEKE